MPRRLGTNEALDRAVDAVTSAHTDFCTRKHGSVQALTKYSAALRTLRVYLDDPVHAQETNTLAAVMILLICQSIMGQTTKGQWWSGHAEGAMQILKARKEFGPRNDFEAKIYMSLRGSVVRSSFISFIPCAVYTNDVIAVRRALQPSNPTQRERMGFSHRE